MRTREQILARVEEIKVLRETATDTEAGVLETELSLLWIELNDLENPEVSSKLKFFKHPW